MSYDAPLVEHWNGSTWTIVPAPTIGLDPHNPAALAKVAAGLASGADENPASADFTSVHAISPDDVWAVGIRSFTNPDQETYTGDQTFTEHWDGTKWSVVAAPDVTVPETSSSAEDDLQAVTGSDGDVWAVGRAQPIGTLVLHWNGTAWSILPSPQTGENGVLETVADLAPNNVWAAGDEIDHWNGQTWSRDPNHQRLRHPDNHGHGRGLEQRHLVCGCQRLHPLRVLAGELSAVRSDRRAGLGFAKALAEDEEQFVRDRRVLEERRLEVPDGEGQGADGRLGGDGRRARAAIDEGDVAERIARTQLAHAPSAARDHGRAGRDQEEAAAVVALLHHDLALSIVDVAHELKDLAGLFLGQASEELDPAEQVDLFAATCHDVLPTPFATGCIIGNDGPD